MEYGEFNSINTSLVEYERTTKRVPTMKSLDSDKKAGKSGVVEEATANDNNGFFTDNAKIDFSNVKVYLKKRLISIHSANLISVP